MPSRNTARQEYRTLRGLNFVWGQMRVPVPGWPGQRGSVPIGLSLYLKEEQARKLNVPYQTRSALAREIVVLSRRNCQRDGFEWSAMGAMRPRRPCASYPRPWRCSRGCSSRGSSCAAAAPDNPAPRMSAQERAVAGVAKNLGPQPLSGWQPRSPTEDNTFL